MQLLVAQLRYQDPMEPVKQEQFLQQLAQFATLEGNEKLNANFEDMLKLEELTQGASLIGKTAVYQADEASAETAGIVESVRVENDRLVLNVNQQDVPIGQVTELRAS